MENDAKLNWTALQAELRSKRNGHPAAFCETCGLGIYSGLVYKVPSAPGVYDTLACLMQHFFGTKKTERPREQMFLAHLRMKHPGLYRTVTGNRAERQESFGFERV